MTAVAFLLKLQRKSPRAGNAADVGRVEPPRVTIKRQGEGLEIEDDIDAQSTLSNSPEVCLDLPQQASEEGAEAPPAVEHHPNEVTRHLRPRRRLRAPRAAVHDDALRQQQLPRIFEHGRDGHGARNGDLAVAVPVQDVREARRGAAHADGLAGLRPLGRHTAAAASAAVAGRPWRLGPFGQELRQARGRPRADQLGRDLEGPTAHMKFHEVSALAQVSGGLQDRARVAVGVAAAAAPSLLPALASSAAANGAGCCVGTDVCSTAPSKDAGSGAASPAAAARRYRAGTLPLLVLHRRRAGRLQSLQRDARGRRDQTAPAEERRGAARRSRRRPRQTRRTRNRPPQLNKLLAGSEAWLFNCRLCLRPGRQPHRHSSHGPSNCALLASSS
mmetsp:Transcript_93774/g.268775  ORF Transcript_93774/g.268775 Transcript_93774/m.268775 type:complete len:388 (-) Transcript_93774:245-1408(-)